MRTLVFLRSHAYYITWKKYHILTYTEAPTTIWCSFRGGFRALVSLALKDPFRTPHSDPRLPLSFAVCFGLLSMVPGKLPGNVPGKFLDLVTV